MLLASTLLFAIISLSIFVLVLYKPAFSLFYSLISYSCWLISFSITLLSFFLFSIFFIIIYADVVSLFLLIFLFFFLFSGCPSWYIFSGSESIIVFSSTIVLKGKSSETKIIVFSFNFNLFLVSSLGGTQDLIFGGLVTWYFEQEHFLLAHDSLMLGWFSLIYFEGVFVSFGWSGS